MIRFLIICLLFLSARILAQDTIHFRNKTVQTVIVTVVSPDSVQYKLPDDTYDLVFSSAKKEIEKICYSNGRTDRFEIAKPEKPAEIFEPVIITRGGFLSQKGNRITYPDMISHAESYLKRRSLPDLQLSLEKAKKDLHKYRAFSDAGLAALIAGGVGTIIGGAFLFSESDTGVPIAGASFFVVNIGVTMEIVSTVIRKNYKKNVKDAAALYNQHVME